MIAASCSLGADHACACIAIAAVKAAAVAAAAISRVISRSVSREGSEHVVVRCYNVRSSGDSTAPTQHYGWCQHLHSITAGVSSVTAGV